jgi:hypothetical protein
MGPPIHARGLSWRPQPGPQSAFVVSPWFEVVYGGARGGGKTDAALGDFAMHAERYKAAAKGLLVRRTRVSLEPTIARARQIFRPVGARWHEQKSAFLWENGAILSFRYLDRDIDADGYQGHDYSRVYVEELTQFADPRAVDKLKATLRSAAGAPCGFRATCNPGGPGHNWVKARYIDAGPPRTPIEEDFVNPFDGSTVRLERVFIPARLSDNPALLKRDPGYVARLHKSGSAQLVRAWLEGDWNLVEGAFFDKWSARNVVRPFAIPAFWTRFRSFDWGYAAPFSVGWWAVASDDHPVEGGVIPRGALVRYREWYGSTGKPGEGLRLDAEQVARGILERDAGETLGQGVADPSIFREDGGPSIGERMGKALGQRWKRGDNTRVGPAGALSGWDQMRARIEGDGRRPMLYVFATCRDFIRTVPVLQHDPARPEDLDTASEDHIADETRYACLSRPLPNAPAIPSTNPNDSWTRDRRLSRQVDSWKTH